ncbi:hypothetical protein FA95DRAFT_1610988 [Auriscalpium vulgare]|uniref:Uncharacterized protein n=1 Tax=Auriscalpium vulgare TaxID=40419 RepID=A0ACB8RBL2_9AGAM|nr:hypothetical protein FA95DRAFT_1610988 [Auriscalpium vulgare]
MKVARPEAEVRAGRREAHRERLHNDVATSQATVSAATSLYWGAVFWYNLESGGCDTAPVLVRLAFRSTVKYERTGTRKMALITEPPPSPSPDASAARHPRQLLLEDAGAFERSVYTPLGVQLQALRGTDDVTVEGCERAAPAGDAAQIRDREHQFVAIRWNFGGEPPAQRLALHSTQARRTDEVRGHR